jgi:hypothetical protein
MKLACLICMGGLVACSADGGGGPMSPGDGGGGVNGGGAAGGSAGNVAGSGGNGAVPMTPRTEADACVAYIESWCLRSVRCGSYDDFFTCAGRLAPQCPDLFFADGSLRTIDNMLDCAATWEQWPCSLDAPPSCAISGTRADGEPCIGVAQCEGWCAGGDVNCGVCEPRAAIGTSCDSTPFCEVGAFCSENFVCEAITTVPTDPPLPGAGESCQDRPCREGYYCVRGSDGAIQCQPPPGAGVARPPGGETCEPLGTPCADGFSCSCADDPCTEYRCLDVARVGEPCGTPGVICHSAATCTGGRCVTTVQAGAFVEACGP